MRLSSEARMARPNARDLRIVVRKDIRPLLNSSTCNTTQWNTHEYYARAIAREMLAVIVCSRAANSSRRMSTMPALTLQRE